MARVSARTRTQRTKSLYYHDTATVYLQIYLNFYPPLAQAYRDSVVRCIPLDTRTTSQADVDPCSPLHGRFHHFHTGLGDSARFLKTKDFGSFYKEDTFGL